MRITPNMFQTYTNRINPLAYTRKVSGNQSTNRSRNIAAMSTLRNRNITYNSIAADRYIKLGENAETLRSSANVLGSATWNGVFENARRTGSKDTILSQTRQMVSGFNNTMNGIRNDSSALNRVYRQLMENAATENSEMLSKVGITVNRDRSLSIDEAKLRSASVDDLETALGSKSGFTTRVRDMAENVSKSAISTATSMSTAYNPYGTLGTLLSGFNRFNFWG